MIQNLKQCCNCAEVLSITCFYKNVSKKDGRQSVCKVCQRESYHKNLEKRKQQSREYYHRNKSSIVKRNRQYYQDNKIVSILSSLKYRAKARGLPFNLTKDDIVIPEFCPLLGIKLKIASGKAQPDSPSVDQIVPGLGYTKDNIWVISHRANVIKNDASPGELVHIGKVLVEMFPHLANASC
jgi:hypothetical protein